MFDPKVLYRAQFLQNTFAKQNRIRGWTAKTDGQGRDIDIMRTA